MKSIATHLILLGISSLAAFGIWTRDEKAEKPAAAQVEVWSGSPDSVESITYETKQRKVRLEAKKDALGRWYVVQYEKEQATPPSGHPPIDGAKAPPAEPGKRETTRFVAVKQADTLVEKLASLRALRSLGKPTAARAADYGLDKPEGTLTVKLGGKNQSLTIGAQTPGGSERYAKHGASGEVFAIEGDLSQSLAFADSRLMERELHGFAADEIKRVRISKGGKSRDLVRVVEKQDAWADVATPTTPNETLVNWMSKLERVRTLEFAEKQAPPPGPDQLVVRVEYFGPSKSLGFLELYKVTGAKGPEYWARTEYTRWFVKVVNTAAEQLDQDLAALLK
jgi:hypothetical protein